MDERQREARLQTLQSELEVERRQRQAAEAEAVAARAACDELRLEVQRAGLEQPLRAQRLRRRGVLVLLVLLVMGLAATATVGVLYYQRVERTLASELARTTRARAEENRSSEQRQVDLLAELKQCRDRSPPCPPLCFAERYQTSRPDPEAAPRFELTKEAWQRSDHAKVVELARKVIEVDSRHEGARVLMGISACTLNDLAAAKEACTLLFGAALVTVQTICRRHHLEVK